MKLISVILVLLGLIAGPGYYFYCASFSGAPLHRVTVFSQDVSSLKVGNVTMQSSGSNAKWNSPITLELTPEMNPISVSAIIRYMKPAGGGMKKTGYRAELTKNGGMLWDKSFAVSAQKEKKEGDAIKIGSGALPKMTTTIKAFTVEDSGEYVLSLHQIGENEVAVAELEVALRRNVILPDMKIVIGGGVALLLAVAGLILTRKKSSQASEAIA